MRRTLTDIFGDEPAASKKKPAAAAAPAAAPTLRPGVPIGPPVPSAADLPDWYQLLGGALSEGLRGFLQGVPQGVTAARNFATQPNPPPPEVPPVGAPNPLANLNFMGGMPIGALSGADLSGTAGAFLKGYHAGQPPVPHAVRNVLGEGAPLIGGMSPQAIADYVLDFSQPETGALLGPAYEAVAGKGLSRAIQGAKILLSPALKTSIGQLVSQKVLNPLGVGPTAGMMREATKPYEQQVAVRLQEGGQIAREMRKTMQGLRLADPALESRLRALPAGDPGPLQRLAQKYAALNLQHGPQSLPTSIDNQAIQMRASVEGVPYAEVKKYGEQLLSHMQQTIGDLYAAGATPFIKARGKSFYNPLPTSPPSPTQVVAQMRTFSAARAAQNPSYAQLVATANRQNSDPLFQAVQVYNRLMTAAVQAGGTGLSPQDRAYLRAVAGFNHLNVKDVYRFGERYMTALSSPTGVFSQLGVTGVAKSAKPFAEDKLRRQFASAYLGQLFASERPQALGQVGAAAFTGSGIREVRRAGLRGLVNQLTDPSDPLSRYVVAAAQPGFVQVKGLRNWGAALSGKYLPEPLYRYLASEISEAGLIGPAGQKVYTKFGKQAGPILTEGQRVWNALGTAAEKYAGLQKKSWIGNFATASSNILSNQAAVEVAARREGFGLPAFAAELPAAAKEVLQYKTTGRPSADISGLRQFSRSFVETQAATAALAGKKGPAELAGLTGRIVTAPGGKRVLLPTAGEVASRAGNTLVALHDYPEKVYKLALYKTLAPRLGPEAAAKAVEKYLFDYSDRGALLETLDRHGLWVFNAFPTKATALLLDTLIHRPDLVARYPRLQAQLMQETPGARQRYQGLADYQKGPFTLPYGADFLDVSRQHVFGDTLRTAQETADAIRGGRLPDYLSPDQLGNLGGHTAASPWISAFLNRQQYGSTAHPVRISHIGAPMEQQIADRAKELGYQMSPGLVRGLGEMRGAQAGIPPKPGRQLTEARKPASVFLQSFLGLKPISGETPEQKSARLAGNPKTQADLDQTTGYMGKVLDYWSAHKDANPYRAHLAGVTDRRAVTTQFFDARDYFKSLLSGPLTDDKRNRLQHASARLLALADRLVELRQP